MSDIRHPDRGRERIYAEQRRLHRERARLNRAERDLLAQSDSEIESAQAVYDRLLPIHDHVGDDLDEPLIDESRISNPRYNSGHPVPRKKGDRILPWRWRDVKRVFRSLLPLVWALAILTFLIMVGAMNAGWLP